MVLATVLLCLYGFFKEMRPSEPFLTPYLRTDKNLTAEEVTNEIYPIWTYSYLAALVFVFLLTDFLRYKPVIILEAVAYIGTWLLLLFGSGVQAMQLMQFVYGAATATEIAYYSYIYAVVHPDQYRRVTSYTRAAILTGDFIAGVLGQILVSLKVATYYQLNIVSLSSVLVAFVVSVFLPSAKESVYFHKNKDADPEPCVDSSDEESLEKQRNKITNVTQLDASPSAGSNIQVDVHRVDDQNVEDDSNRVQNEDDEFWGVAETSNNSRAMRTDRHATEDSKVTDLLSEEKQKTLDIHWSTCCTDCKENFSFLWTDFKTCYSSSHLLKWSLWWAFATCGNFLVGNYVQNLWDLILPSDDDSVAIYNGAVEAVATLSGAFAAFILAFIRFNWTIFGELTLGIVSLLDAGVLLTMALTSYIWIAYGFYVLFRASYQFLITIASFQIASHLTTERYALVFGCNTFLALALQSIVTVIVVDQHGLHLPANTQFLIYSGYFFIIGCMFMSKAVFTLTRAGWMASCRQRWDTREADAGNCEEKYLAEQMEKTEEPTPEKSDSGDGSEPEENVLSTSQTSEERRPLII